MLACHSRREGHPESPNFGAIYSPGQSKPLSVSSFLLLSTKPNLNLQDIPQRSVKQVTPRSSLIFKNSIAASISSRGSLYLSWAHRLDTMELLRSSLTKTRCSSKGKKPEMPTPIFQSRENGALSIWMPPTSRGCSERSRRSSQQAYSRFTSSQALLGTERGCQAGCFRSFRPQRRLGKLVPAQLRPNFI